MTRTKQVNTKMGVLAKALTIMGLALFFLAMPATAYASNQSNSAYQAPDYQFETTFTYDQWGRPTTSNVAPQHTQNVRRDRHSANLPPSHGTVSGFYSGEFATEQVNPFAPVFNNNPNASHAVFVEGSSFALIPGETGVNVQADGSHSGGFLASTSVTQNGGNTSYSGSANDTNAPWTNTGNQSGSSQDGFTANYKPIESTQTGSQQQGRITVVTPFEDGTIGKITIPALNNRVASVYPGVELNTLSNHVGHFPATSQWDGNIALASHNRGTGSFFAGIWTLQNGDRIFYETTMGVRAFEVVSVSQISETDLENLDYSYENTLTLITCVSNRPELRWSVCAREVV